MECSRCASPSDRSCAHAVSRYRAAELTAVPDRQAGHCRILALRPCEPMRGLALAFAPQAAVQPRLVQQRLRRVLRDWCPLFSGYHSYHPQPAAGLARLWATSRRTPISTNRALIVASSDLRRVCARCLSRLVGDEIAGRQLPLFACIHHVEYLLLETKILRS